MQRCQSHVQVAVRLLFTWWVSCPRKTSTKFTLQSVVVYVANEFEGLSKQDQMLDGNHGVCAGRN